MKNVANINWYGIKDNKSLDSIYEECYKLLNRKIIVLDDDPTGIQTVHGVPVFTHWDKESILKGFKDDSNLFFLLTNSRSLTFDQTIKIHKDIARSVAEAAKETGIKFLIVSRSDSTLRGHFPIETETLKEILHQNFELKIDGEIICPFFKEGGRVTIGNIHYVKNQKGMTPVAETEFAADKTFGYSQSHLGLWCEEKTEGKFKADNLVYIDLKMIRSYDVEGIYNQLMMVEDFNKVIVNAEEYSDLKIFAIALIKAIIDGKEFIFRAAASILNILGNIAARPLLGKEEIEDLNSNHGGVVVVGSFVKTTTQQLDYMKESDLLLEFIEFDCHLVIDETAFNNEIIRVTNLMNDLVSRGKTVVIYSRRDYLDISQMGKEKQLLLSVKISEGLTKIISGLTVRPRFLIAKGGITSSDVGVKSLQVNKAMVLGQVRPGIPVWKTSEESKFPGISYVIFPGNVGDISTLKEVVEIVI